MVGQRNAGGSKWHRWDPHLHAPGTILNDQYGGTDPWNDFLLKIEAADPPIRALGVTDYYSTDGYDGARKHKQAGRLAGVEFIFPNVEMRLAVGTAKGSAINVHLLVDPAATDHIEQTWRFLRALTFDAYGETFRCEQADLVRLGRAHDKSAATDKVALRVGVNQFKVNPDQLRIEWKRSSWAQENTLIAVAGGSGDGTSGLKGDASLAAMRKELERMAHIIFSAQPKQRDFWLGRGAASLEKLDADWGGRKPCLHGSDAHDLEHVAKPDQDRFSWLKGDLVFDTLRQACLEPETRVFIGEAPPRGALPSQSIAAVSLSEAAWFDAEGVPLNSGLVGIIGARGSGKTALADVIAAGGHGLAQQLSERSFVRRATPLLGKSAAHLEWDDGSASSGRLRDAEVDGIFEHPRVQYLSQQFVDVLCSAEGLTDELLTEMERVIFQAHPPEDRMGTTSFRELLDLRAARGRGMREKHESLIAEIGDELLVERERRNGLPALERQRTDLIASIAKDKKDRSSFIGKGGEERAKRLDEVAGAAELVSAQIEHVRRRRQALVALQDEVNDHRENRAQTRLRQLQQAHRDAGLEADRWAEFRLDFVGDVDAIIASALKAAEKEIGELTGPSDPKIEPPSEIAPLDPQEPLGLLPLRSLNREVARLRAQIGIDEQNARTFARLSEKISRDEALLAKLERDIAEAKRADENIAALLKRRNESYGKVFDGIAEEEQELEAMYGPLKERLAGEGGSLGKLSFVIRRLVNTQKWAKQGEALMDLRSGPFRGHGALREAAEKDLLQAWRTGSGTDVAAAMARFRKTHEQGIIESAPVARTQKDAYGEWATKVSGWLYGTEHVTLTYSVQYEGVDIEQLSPGTRGIVLLLLYLAIDRDDDRPLIIDQPEENLDPKSIFDELVQRFRQAKLRRQIIIVTHNANLIVNADADQVIVASCGPHRAGELPLISYVSGGLENPDIRRQVCEILEGGEAAFRERARRLRVRM
jgi:hypothetical protein